MTPSPKLIVEQADFFGNRATYFMVEEPHEELSLTAVSEADVVPFAAPDSAVTPPWESVRAFLEQDHSPQGLEARQFVYDSRYIKANPELADYAAPSFTVGRPVLEAARDLTRRIHQDFRYDTTATTVATPLHEVLEHRRGVCQDFAHLQIGCLRCAGAVRPLRERLPADGSAPQPGAISGCGRFSRLVVGLLPRVRLGRS